MLSSTSVELVDECGGRLKGTPNDQRSHPRNFNYVGRAFDALVMGGSSHQVPRVSIWNESAHSSETGTDELLRGEGDPSTSGADSRTGLAARSISRFFPLSRPRERHPVKL